MPAESLTHQAAYIPGQGVPLFELRPPVLTGADWTLKRAFDLLVSAVIVGGGPPHPPRGPARHPRPLADLRALRPLLRRPRPPRLLLPRELVDLARHLDPAEDDPGRSRPARRLPG